MTRKCGWVQLFFVFVSWSFIKCDCPFPKEEILNGEYIYASPTDNRVVATEEYILYFRCSVGYERTGERAIQCLDGKWSNNVPSCKAMPCDAPPSIDNGIFTFNTEDETVTIGTQAMYSCSPGYELKDTSVSNLTCILNEDADETLWAGEIPICQAVVPCPDPGVSMDGSREGLCCLPGNIVSYSCNEGFEMVGEKDIECLVSKRWSSTRPLCRPLKEHCDLPPLIPNGVVVRESGDYVLPREEAEIVCKPGYRYNGTNQLPYCNSSALWADEFGECVEIVCDHPGLLPNGNIPELGESDINDTFPYNYVLTYDCKEGYRLRGGDPWKFCGEDGWSGNDSSCEEIICPDPGTPDGGSRQGDSFKVGSKVRFSCSSGLELLGSVERYCKPNGKWTGDLARCNEPENHCPNPGTPINGWKDGVSYEEGDMVQFRCRSGFIQSGSKDRTCMADRTWSGTETKCLASYDFDSTREIGENLKHRLNEKFNDDMREYIKYADARGLSENERELPPPDKMIMYFAFDVSGSIQLQNFKKGIDFAKAMVNKIGVSENGARVGALVFSDKPINIFFPMDFKTKEDVLRELDTIQYTGGGTSATSALQMMINNIKLQQQHFENKTAVLFLITDGKANMGGKPENEADILKKLNVEIFCIGITGDVRADSLHAIASKSRHGKEERPNVFILKNYESLKYIIQDITNGTIDYSQCGFGMESKMNSNVGKIIGGEISVEPWPWMAALFFKDSKAKNSKLELKCGGSIINERFILTAAHCIFELDIKKKEYRRRKEEEIIVKLGLVHLKNETYVQSFEVEAMYHHEDYAPGGFYDNDIALLKLSKPIIYRPHVRPVCLPPAAPKVEDSNPFYRAEEYGWTVGFGHQKRVSPAEQRNVQYMLSKQLKELRMPIQPEERCVKSFVSKGHEKKLITERMFCAGDGESGNDTCKGDSGGPFMQHNMNSEGLVYWTQVGIVSWGVGCGNKNRYGYYTHVQKFREWIDEKLKPAKDAV